MNTQHLKNIVVVGIDDGVRHGTVGRMLLSSDARSIVALQVTSGGAGLFSTEPAQSHWLVADDIIAVGPDALTIRDGAVLGETAPSDETLDFNDLHKRKVVTEDGTYVGEISSADFDDDNLTLNSILVSSGMLSSNRSVPIERVLTVGSELVIVAAVASDHEAEAAARSESSRVIFEEGPPVESDPDNERAGSAS